MEALGKPVLPRVVVLGILLEDVCSECQLRHATAYPRHNGSAVVPMYDASQSQRNVKDTVPCLVRFDVVARDVGHKVELGGQVDL